MHEWHAQHLGRGYFISSLLANQNNDERTTVDLNLYLPIGTSVFNIFYVFLSRLKKGKNRTISYMTVNIRFLCVFFLPCVVNKDE